MKFQLLSDLHCEFYDDQGEGLVSGLSLSRADVLLIAGDLGKLKPCYKKIIPILAKKSKEVVLVLGNHEYYGKQMIGYMWQHLSQLERKYPNFHVLNNSMIELNGIKIYGGTMWFDYDPLNVIYSSSLNDFRQIRLFEGWVYNNNFSFKANLMNGKKPDIILTHHLPSYHCVQGNYVGNNLNRFYVSEMSKYILDKKPTLWVHGHSHDSSDIEIGETRIMSNPLGYPGQYNQKFIEELIIEL